jgi:hypothetical protein
VSAVAISAPLDARDVKARADLVAIAGRYTRLRRAGRQFVGLCPFHSERRPSFYVEPERKIWKCFGCGLGGDLFDFVMRAEGCDFPLALEIAAGFSFGGASEGRSVFARPERAGAKPPGPQSGPARIARKPEPEPRSFSSANRWPSVEDCAAERASFT